MIWRCAAPPAPARSRSTPTAGWCASSAREDGMAGQDIVLGARHGAAGSRRCSAAPRKAAPPASCSMPGPARCWRWLRPPASTPAPSPPGSRPALWQQLITDPMNPLNDKAISGTYAPGSTFKPMVAMAALEAGVITPDTEFYCPGQFHLGNAVFHCWKKGGHGTLVAAPRDQGILRRLLLSHGAICSASIASRRWRNRFGLGVELGIDIPGEKSGLIPTRAWKLATTGVPWQRGETISCGIGQSFVSVTPLQLAIYGGAAGHRAGRRAAAPAQAGADDAGRAAAERREPGLRAAGRAAEASRRSCSTACMAVVNEQHGTAYGARITDPVMAMAGKTGTAQVRHITEAEREHGHLTGQSVPWKERDHALFIAFAPVGAPRYACAVVVEHGGAIGGERRRRGGADRPRRVARGADARSRRVACRRSPSAADHCGARLSMRGLAHRSTTAPRGLGLRGEALQHQLGPGAAARGGRRHRLRHALFRRQRQLAALGRAQAMRFARRARAR